ncbi:MAG: thioredoxin domain-containing protein [Acidobacteria bacterium]|nr:thioredoxin domain-containing protein [Acidobacteriota bacterium]
MPNRLAAEQSPYLLQHAANPVDWHAWGEDAFRKAREENKPIFLSIGYSTCHWCHVMEHESFEDAAVAAVLNEHFVSIKVDREERPDVDRVYMTFVQATTGQGGWPMSVWLTPALEPFYGGTYYPPASQWGRPGFRDVLLEIARAWRDERVELIRSATDVVARLAGLTHSAPSAQAIGVEALASTLRQFRQSFDARYGGFGDQPKFPRPSELLFLLREHARTGDDDARRMALQTLTAMALGGMRDHIGGGFHRYSVDRQWRVPHFEKMLYDQAQLVLAYLEGAQACGDAFFAHVADDTLQYVERELSDESGGFHSAEDADSLPPEDRGRSDARKTEGAFYIWTADEIRTLLGENSRIFELRYGVLSDGNAPFDPQNEFGRKNLLYTARGIADVSKETALDADQITEVLARARRTLFEARARRPRPHLDDKVLTAWNGLMIGAFARAARVLEPTAVDGQPAGSHVPGGSHLQRARRAARFLKSTMWDPESRTLRRRYRAGHALAAAHGRFVLGPDRWWMVQHHGPGSIRAHSPEGRA